MLTGIILIIVGVAAVVACRAYVSEPVVRTVGVVVGVVVAVFGLYLFLMGLVGVSDESLDVDSRAPVSVVAR